MMDWFTCWLRMQPIPNKEPPEIEALMQQLDRQQDTARQATDTARRIVRVTNFGDTIDNIAGDL